MSGPSYFTSVNKLNLTLALSRRAMFNDEAVYPEPRRFNPERFMLDGKLNPNVRDPDTAAFGFGRRVCPGRFMAKDSAWIAIAMILATLEIKPVVDKNGVPDLPAGEYKQGLIASVPTLSSRSVILMSFGLSGFLSPSQRTFAYGLTSIATCFFTRRHCPVNKMLLLQQIIGLSSNCWRITGCDTTAYRASTSLFV